MKNGQVKKGADRMTRADGVNIRLSDRRAKNTNHYLSSIGLLINVNMELEE